MLVPRFQNLQSWRGCACKLHRGTPSTDSAECWNSPAYEFNSSQFGISTFTAFLVEWTTSRLKTCSRKHNAILKGENKKEIIFIDLHCRERRLLLGLGWVIQPQLHSRCLLSLVSNKTVLPPIKVRYACELCCSLTAFVRRFFIQPR